MSRPSCGNWKSTAHRRTGGDEPRKLSFSEAERHPPSNLRTFGKLLAWVAATFPIGADCEITLEANPRTVDRSNFHGYHDAGVNRISVGIQSFQRRLLRLLGRIHTAEEGGRALQTVRQAGFENFSFDLIYAVPGQVLRDLEADLDEALAFNPPHLSAYRKSIQMDVSKRTTPVLSHRLQVPFPLHSAA